MRTLLIACLLVCVAAAAAGQDRPAVEPSEGQSAPSNPLNWLDKISISGILDAESRWMRFRDAPARAAGSVSDLYLRQFNLGVETRLLQGASAIVVLNSEWIGDDLNQGDDRISLDEVHCDLEGIPYFVLGKRTQPFGQFECDLATDPITQDAYETNCVGASVGVRGAGELDISATVYKGTEQMEQLFQSGFFDTTKVRRAASSVEHIGSFVVSALASPWPGRLTVFGAFLSEPGSDRRNASIDAGLSLVPPRLANLTIDFEYAGAVSRELYAGLGKRHRESALSAAASYAFVVKDRLLRGRRTYLSRRSSHSAHPAVVSLRYELFDDDGLASALHSWSLKSRASVGGRYAFRNDGSVLAYLQFEWRESDYRVAGSAHGRQDEAYLRVGVDF